MTEEARRRALERARIEEEAACVVARLADADDPHGQEAAHRWAGQSPARAIAIARAETASDRAEAIAGPAGRLEALFTRRRTAAASAPAALMIVAVEKLTPVDRVSTETGQQRTVVLAGVSVLLDTATTIEMATRAGERAAPVLEGEAEFDVAPYLRRPFGVSAKGGVVRSRAPASICASAAIWSSRPSRAAGYRFAKATARFAASPPVTVRRRATVRLRSSLPVGTSKDRCR